MALGATLKVKMDTAGVSRGLAGMKSKVGRAFGAIRKIGLAAFTAIAAAATGLFAAAINAKNFVREIHLMSLQTGMAADDVLTFQNALERFGLETSAAADFVSEFQKRLSEAAQGEGEAVKGLEKLGLAVDDVTGLDAIDAFEKVVNAIHSIGLNSEDAAFAMDKLFGGQGFRLVAMAKDFKRIMAEARMDTAGVAAALGDPERFERFERSLSRIKLIVREIQLRFVEALPLDRLNEVLDNVDLDGFGERLTSEMEEFLKAPEAKFVEWGTFLGRAIGEGIIKGMFSYFTTAEGIKTLAETFSGPAIFGRHMREGGKKAERESERRTPDEEIDHRSKHRFNWELFNKIFGRKDKGGAQTEMGPTSSLGKDLLQEARDTNGHLRRISDGGATFA